MIPLSIPASGPQPVAVAGGKMRCVINGILLLDKPERMTSNQALQAVKRLFNAKKAGHTGSLDPLASGLLPVCFGEATKVSGFLLESDKEYQVTCRFGTRTTTGDAEGEVAETCPVPVLADAKIQKVLAGFLGEIQQTPPMYSALKHQGQRLYDLAREGIEVPREPRTVQIHELRMLESAATELQLRVRCSKGTYIRTLVEDIARALGACGHVGALRRLSVGPYGRMLPIYTLAELQLRASAGPGTLQELLLPVDSAVTHWPVVKLSADAAWYFLRGQAVLASGAPLYGWLRVYDEARFLGLGEMLADGRVTPRRLLNFG